MSYRDGRDAERARADELEERLDDAQREIARLRGETNDARTSSRSWLVGAPKRLVIERELPFEIAPEGYEAIADLLHKRLGVVASQVGRKLNADRLTIEHDAGVTRVRVVVDATSGENAVVAATSLGALAGTLVTAGVLHDAAHVSPAYALIALPLLAAASFFGMRRRARRDMERTRQKWAGALEAVVDAAREHAIRARVVASEDATSDASGETEAARARTTP